MTSSNFISGALFVDFENIFYSTLNPPLSLKSDAAVSVTMDVLSALRQHARDDGNALVVERSYADWERMPAATQRQLQISGILPRFADSRVDKNTADIELSLDVLELMLTRDELLHFILVGGDRDYLPILRRLKEQHRQVTICAFRHSLSGDIREFASNYRLAKVIELDDLIELPEPQPRMRPLPDEPLDPPAANEDGFSEWHERYLSAMLRFMEENSYKEIHLGPFFRWLQSERIFELVSIPQQRKVFEQLKNSTALNVEERDTGQGYTFSVVALNEHHHLVQELRERLDG